MVTLLLSAMLIGTEIRPACPYPPSDWLLVEGECLKTDRLIGLSIESVFKVTRMYIGADDLRGKTFQARYASSDAFFGFYCSRVLEFFPFRQGERCHWWVRERDNKLEAVWDYEDLQKVVPLPYKFTFPLGATKRVVPFPCSLPTEQVACEWAQAIAAIAQAKDDAKRQKLLEGYAASKHEDIATWAAWLLKQ